MSGFDAKVEPVRAISTFSAMAKGPRRAVAMAPKVGITNDVDGEWEYGYDEGVMRITSGGRRAACFASEYDNECDEWGAAREVGCLMQFQFFNVGFYDPLGNWPDRCDGLIEMAMNRDGCGWSW